MSVMITSLHDMKLHLNSYPHTLTRNRTILTLGLMHAIAACMLQVTLATALTRRLVGRSWHDSLVVLLLKNAGTQHLQLSESSTLVPVEKYFKLKCHRFYPKKDMNLGSQSRSISCQNNPCRKGLPQPRFENTTSRKYRQYAIDVSSYLPIHVV